MKLMKLTAEVTLVRFVTLVAIVLSSLAMSSVAGAGQTNDLQRQVEDAMRGRDLRNVEVSVQGSEATLAGRVPHFWAKDQAIKRALDVDGIETVATELELPEPEDDNDLAEQIAKAVQRYPHYTMWDHITGRVNEGKVLLGGWVTPERAKDEELFERVGKIKGVQDVQNDIEVLPPAQSDMNLRNSIQRQLAANTHFERFANMMHPPFHIVIRNGHVLLVGYVQTQVEVIEMQRIVGQTQGVLRVENQLQTLQ